MKLDDYLVISQFIKTRYQLFSPRDTLHALIQKFYPKFSYNTLMSICLFHSQEQIKSKYADKVTEKNGQKLYASYHDKAQHSGTSNELIMLSLCKEFGIPPALCARVILKKHLQLLTSPDANIDNMLHVKTEVTKLMRDPLLIEDGTLSLNVRQSILNDMCSGPVTDAIRHMIGVEHEEKLLSYVRALNIPFQDENELRKLGYDKTPDIKLEIPILVKGQMVCWIESKALFGNPKAHQGYLKEQYYSYWNRFGPGLVIYWYGFVDELASKALKEEIMILDDFPNSSDILHFKSKCKKIKF